MSLIRDKPLHWFAVHMVLLFTFQRYQYYITKGIPTSALAAQDPEVMDRVLQGRIPEKLRVNPDLENLIGELKGEVTTDYDFSVRKSIGETPFCHVGGTHHLLCTLDYAQKCRVWRCGLNMFSSEYLTLGIVHLAGYNDCWWATSCFVVLVVDYILKDPTEKGRLHIKSTPEPFHLR